MTIQELTHTIIPATTANSCGCWSNTTKLTIHDHKGIRLTVDIARDHAGHYIYGAIWTDTSISGGATPCAQMLDGTLKETLRQYLMSLRDRWHKHPAFTKSIEQAITQLKAPVQLDLFA